MAAEAGALTVADVRARFRWNRMCMSLLILQDDMRIAREIAATTPRKSIRW
jgi:hypothetical protein